MDYRQVDMYELTVFISTLLSLCWVMQLYFIIANSALPDSCVQATVFNTKTQLNPKGDREQSEGTVPTSPHIAPHAINHSTITIAVRSLVKVH